MIKNQTWDYANVYEWMERVSNMSPLIITVAVNGGVQGKESNEAIPETPDQIAQSTYDAYNAGASSVHIHGRNPVCLYDNICDEGIYREINRMVREKCPDIIINNSTGGGPKTTMEERFNGLKAMPELASLNMGPDMLRFQIKPRKAPLAHPHDGLCFDETTPYTYGIVESLAREMKAKGIKPEMELYHPGQYWVSQELIRLGLLEPPYLFQYVLGYQTASYPSPENVVNLIKQLPKGSLFSMIGIGKFQWIMTTMGIILGGNVRVGLEDNIYAERGVKLQSNAEAVEKIVRIARELGREIATPQEAREIMGLSTTPSKY